jgi:hypothetical protein
LRLLFVSGALTNLNPQANDIGGHYAAGKLVATPEGPAAIAHALRVNGVLTSLTLFWNEIGDHGAKAIAEAIKVNSVLTSLNLYKNYIGDEGAKAIGDALHVNGALTSLNLKYNDIGDGKAALRKIAKDRPSLTIEL